MTSQNDTRSRILTAALPLFYRYGMRKTTIDEIARDAGIGKGTVYNYFETKEAIFLAAKRSEIDRFFALIREAIDPAASASRQLHQFIATWFHHFEEHRKEFPLSAEAMAEISSVPEAGQVVFEIKRGLTSLMQDILAHGVAREEFRVPSVDAACWTMHIALNGLACEQMWPQERDDAVIPSAAKAEIVSSMLVAAFRGGATTFNP